MTADLDELKRRVGAADESTKIVLKKGDTFWRLAEIKYGGIHPIDAIYAVNGLQPKYEDRDGKRVLVDPIYYAGKEYTLPGSEDLAQLKSDFWTKFDPATDEERLGVPEESSLVCLRWDENFSQLTKKKYNGRDASHAVFELNDMSPTIKAANGDKQVCEPICQAGWSYNFPAENEISELEKRYSERVKRLLRD
ncbi:MAG TPA: hypothetical protein V6C89_15340 [Drouetiella sp.]